MGEGAPAAGPGPRDVDDLLPLAGSRPREALARAQAILAARPGPYEASVAHQATGIVLREYGDVDAGVRELRSALRLARRTGSAEREADVLGSLGVGLVYAGRTSDGIATFDRAVELSTGVLTGGCCSGAVSRCGPSAGTARPWMICGVRSAGCGVPAIRSGRRGH